MAMYLSDRLPKELCAIVDDYLMISQEDVYEKKKLILYDIEAISEIRLDNEHMPHVLAVVNFVNLPMPVLIRQ